MTINVGINGLGRIGRMVIRAIIESQNKHIKIIDLILKQAVI
jgi:glyceraldehyde 3-phosphate dehydrogenase